MHLTPALSAPAATAILARLLGVHWGTAGGGLTGATVGSAPTLLAHAGGSLFLKAAAGVTIMAIATAGTVHFAAAAKPHSGTEAGRPAPLVLLRTRPIGLSRKRT